MAIYKSGTLINNRYEVVQGPYEKPTLAGGMGLVYLCVDHGENGRPVALKTFRPEYLPNREARDRFLREGTTWVQLGNHPHIVRCHQVLKVDVGSEIFFVLELVAAAEGKRDASLRSWLTPGKPLPVEQTLLFALHIARGMKHATEKIPGLVHRDLKPENVLVGRDGVARITDFGLASAVQKAGGKLQVTNDKERDKRNFERTQLTRGIVGTPLYMAPEQWAGAELDARSDIYAFGCILYEMLTGSFAVAGESIEEIAAFHHNNPEYELPVNLPAEVGGLLQRCLSTQSPDRYQHWEEVSSVLESAYEAISGEAFPALTDSGKEEEEQLAAGYSYNALGLSYHDIGKFEVARDYYKKVLDIAQKQQHRSLQAIALNNLGNAYLQLGDARGAIEFFKQRLAISRETGNRPGEGVALGNLGTAYRQLGDVQRAIEFFEQDLVISREIGDRPGEGQALGNLGIAYSQLGDARRAIEFFEQDLVVSREIGDRPGEGTALGNLGIAYSQLGDAQRAIEFFEQHLAISREIGDRHGEGRALGNLGTVYNQLRDARRAIEFYEQSLVIMQEVGDVLNEAMTSLNIAILYSTQRSFNKALEHAEFARQVFDQTGHSENADKAHRLLQIIYEVSGNK